MSSVRSDSGSKLASNQVKNNPISNKQTTRIFFICSILLCFVIAINAIYETPLFILGINFIYEYQKMQPYNFLHVVQNLFSFLCNPIGVGAVMVIYYIVVNRKLLLIVHLSYFLLANYVLSLLKQSFQQSRPIWVNDQIEKWEWFCPKDFGNPSGHSFAVVMLYEPIVSDSIGYGKHRFWTIFLFVICVMVPISRMYLGVHSANQIFFGLVLGMLFLVLYKYVYQRYLYYLYWGLLMNHRKWQKLIIAIIVHILALIVPIIFYSINLSSRPVPIKDIQNLNKKCGIEMTGEKVQGHMLTSCSHQSFFFGIFYGFVLLMDTPGYRKYLLGLWAYESWKHVALKLGVYLICAVLPMSIFQGIGKYAVENSIGRYCLFSMGALVFGLGLSFFAPVVTSRFNIMKLLPGPAKNYEDKFQQLN